MDLKQIRYFVAVADARSLTAGARRAFVTQSTLSEAIKAAEAEIGVELFERHARGVTLTPAGKRALAHARAVLRETERLKSAARETPAARPLRIGLATTLPPELVASVLSAVRKSAGARGWTAQDASDVRLAGSLRSGRLDAILTSLKDAEPGHQQVTMMSDRQALAMSDDALPDADVSPAVLSSAPLIIRTHCEHLETASRILDRFHVKPRIVARTDSDARALEMVAAGLGACLMPDSLRRNGVDFVYPIGVDLKRRLGLEWIKGAADGWFDQHAEVVAATVLQENQGWTGQLETTFDAR